VGRRISIWIILACLPICSARSQTVQEAIPLTDRSRSEYAVPPSVPEEIAPDFSESQGTSEQSPGEAQENLLLSDVIASVYRNFPAIQEARLEAGVADGRLTSAFGAYDLRLNATSLNQPTGFYETYRQGLGAIRQTWWGGFVSAGYRVGRGQFEPWYKERQTNLGGEYTLGFGMPLLQGRAIDPQRAAVFQAGLDQRAVGPLVQTILLNTSRDASVLYWEWVAAGARVAAQDELLELAQERQQQFERGAEAGRFAEIDVVFNRKLVAERANRRLQAENTFRLAGFRLSLFLRDEAGIGLIPNDQWLPAHFPVINPMPPGDFNADFQAALSRRPELAILAIEAQKVRVERQLADNDRLPTLDLLAQAAQDSGRPVSSPDDKGQFELMVGIQSDVPLQRRNALGRIQQANSKLSQIEQKLRFQRDKIAVELQSAYNSLIIAAQQVEQTEIAFKAAIETLQGFRFAFKQGFADLLELNILETQTNEAEILLIDAQRDWFRSLADMQAALGLDPLEQAINVSALPESTRLGPGDMPMGDPDDPAEVQKLEEDWQKHLNRNGQ
jgi:outer membrane protein TolC